MVTAKNKTAEDFALKLRNLIKKSGISRYKIANETKITQATLSNYINGKVDRPSPSNVMQLAKFFDVDYDWLMCKEPKTKAAERESRYFLKQKGDLQTINELFELNRKYDEIRDIISSIEDKMDILIQENSSRGK